MVILGWDILGKETIISYSLLESIANLLIVIKFELMRILYKQQQKEKEPKAKPFIVAIKEEVKNSYIILGSNG